MQHNGSATTLRPLPVSMAGTALSPPRGVDVGVGVVVRMPRRAVGSGALAPALSRAAVAAGETPLPSARSASPGDAPLGLDDHVVGVPLRAVSLGLVRSTASAQVLVVGDDLQVGGVDTQSVLTVVPTPARGIQGVAKMIEHPPIWDRTSLKGERHPVSADLAEPAVPMAGLAGPDPARGAQHGVHQTIEIDLSPESLHAGDRTRGV